MTTAKYTGQKLKLIAEKVVRLGPGQYKTIDRRSTVRPDTFESFKGLHWDVYY